MVLRTTSAESDIAAFVDLVAHRVDHIGVVADAAFQGVLAGSAIEPVVAAEALDGIVAAAAAENVVAAIAGRSRCSRHCRRR